MIYDMNRSKPFYRNVVRQKTILEGTLHASHGPLVEKERNDAQDDFPTSVWEAMWNEESALLTTRMGTEVHEGTPVQRKNLPVESHRKENEDVITRDMKCAVKQLFKNKWSTMVERLLDSTSCMLLRNTQIGNQSVF